MMTVKAVRTTATTNYTLSLNDMSAWTNIIAMQTKAGSSALFNDATCAAFAYWNAYFTLNKRSDWMGGGWQVHDNTPVYSLITNTDLLQWTANLFTQLTQLQVPAYTVAYYETFTAWMIGMLFTEVGGLKPENVGGWGDLITATLTKWNNQRPANLLDFDETTAASWSNPSGLQPAISVLWTDQSNALKTLTGLNELTSDQCIYIMYLLPSLITGNTDQQNRVNKIVSASCNSMELPNSNFYTSLVYHNLMLLADPMGAYVQTNPQIQSIINGLLSTITGTDPGSIAMKAALSTQAKILLVSANYPMVDPYNPSIGFSTRQSDMLEAVNTTWVQLQSSSQVKTIL